ncbi:MAG TPA: HAMP domain-containing sensor histidine kinase [Polyangiales bacterium]|nr:HAMP domain-containing sensor histidine kinase [Polyangiales bacterium]
MTTTAPLQPLALLRRRLTFWYAATLSLILLLLGGGLYGAIHSQLAQQLDVSLRGATKELIRAAHIREMEAATAHGNVVDAVDELRIPDRALFLLDSAGMPIKPDTASAWIRAAAQRAAVGPAVEAEIAASNQHTLSLYAERFRLGSGQMLVAVAVADQVELTDRYAALIAAFSGAALAAIVLVAAGGYFLVQKATAPAERSMAYTRRFMADAAHELRTPIAVLRTKADVALQEARTPESYETTLRGMGHEAQRLGRVVDDLLMLARADAGERRVERTRFFLDDVVLDAAMSIRTLAQAADVEMIVDEFEETAVIGDANLVRELVVVLLDNAVKFTPPGGSVRVSVMPEPQPTLIVEDTGRGIPSDQLPHVFERFYRGDASRPREGGAGLGLSIAQWVAAVHDARVELSSEAGAGTRATVVFPKPMGTTA